MFMRPLDLQAKGWPAVRGIVEVILGLFGLFEMLTGFGDLCELV